MAKPIFRDEVRTFITRPEQRHGYRLASINWAARGDRVPSGRTYYNPTIVAKALAESAA